MPRGSWRVKETFLQGRRRASGLPLQTLASLNNCGWPTKASPRRYTGELQRIEKDRVPVKNAHDLPNDLRPFSPFVTTTSRSESLGERKQRRARRRSIRYDGRFTSPSIGMISQPRPMLALTLQSVDSVLRRRISAEPVRESRLRVRVNRSEARGLFTFSLVDNAHENLA
jgi:hypothetical protein